MQTTQGSPIEVGTTVYTSDGDRIGDVAEVQQSYFVIEKGFIFKEDLYIPMSALASREADGVRLSLTKDEIETQDWSSVPVLRDQRAAGPVGYGGQHTDATGAFGTPPGAINTAGPADLAGDDETARP